MDKNKIWGYLIIIVYSLEFEHRRQFDKIIINLYTFFVIYKIII